MNVLAKDGMRGGGAVRLAQFACALLFAVVIAGCLSPSQPAASPSPSALPSASATQATACGDKDCFILAANDCKNLTLVITDDAGVFKYSSSGGCVFTKTLVSLNESETSQMKLLLTGKSFSCNYEKGKFDRRLVESLLYGMENCDGELKDILGQLLAFT